MVLGIILLFISDSTGDSPNKRIDQRITFRRVDKIPYGTFVAYSNLHYLFPDASILTEKSEPGYWDSLSNYDDKQAYIIITDRFNADEDELKRMIRFAETATTYL